MEKTARLRQMVKCQSTYDGIIKAYKNLLREGDKHSLYRFKGILYACLNANNEPGWRKVDDFFGEENLPHAVKYLICGKQENWFGQELAECIKKTI